MSKDKLIPEIRFPEFKNEGEWVEKTIEDFAPIQRGFDLPVDDIIVGDYPVVFSNGILKYHKEYKVKAPGVVTGRSGTIGKVTYVEKDFWPHNTSLWVTDFCGNYPLFVYHYFVRIGLERFRAGGGVPTLNRNDVHRSKIFIPISKKEQQKIASCLSSLDDLIAAQSQKLELLKDHKKGLMQNLFPQLSESGFTRLKDDRIDDADEQKILKSQNPKNPDSDNIPKYRFKEFEKDGEWVEKKLGELGDFLGGGTPSRTNSEYWSGNIPWISSSDINDDDIHTISISQYINENSILESATKKIPVGSILFVSRVGVGKLAVNKGELCTSQDFTSFIPTEVLNLFVAYYFSANKKSLQTLSQGTSIKGFSKSDLEDSKISYPKNPKEQQKIASCLSSLDALITAQAEKIEQLKLHKKGLMQGLFPKLSETGFAELRDEQDDEERA